MIFIKLILVIVLKVILLEILNVHHIPIQFLSHFDKSFRKNLFNIGKIIIILRK